MSLYLVHWGTHGMKWGRRRYQNPDGTWTEEGKMRRRLSDGTQNENSEKRVKGGAKANSGIGNDDPSIAKKREAAIEAEKRLKEKRNISKAMEDYDNEELRKRIERADLEKKYIDIMQDIWKKTTKPRVWTPIIKKIGENTVANIGGQLSVYLVGQFVNKVAAKAGAQGPIVNPKKGQKDK